MTTAPTTPAELEELVGDRTKLDAAITDGSFYDALGAYARKMYEADMDLKQQIDAQCQMVFAEMLKDTGADIQRPNQLPVAQIAAAYRPGQAPATYNPKAMGAALDKDFTGSADYFRTIWHNTNNTADRMAKLSRVRNAFSSTVPSEGGFLIPETLRSELLRVALETSVVRQRAFDQDSALSVDDHDHMKRSAAVFAAKL